MKRPIPVTTIEDAKTALRARARDVRRAAHRAQSREAAAAIRAHWREAAAQGLLVTPGLPVAGYWPLRDELDVRGLLADLVSGGADMSLPAVVAPDRPLAFRRWRPGDVLVAGALGTAEPPPDARAIVPRLLIVPLVAFDRAGYRLGMGRGYYDRTLRALRAAGPVIAVGVGFAAQEVAEAPHDGFDERLDWVVTERGARRFGG
jgi:5-formyltetrahydrofolate cyclo-ligase